MDKELWKQCISFHGHECPGLAIGFKAVEGAAAELNLVFSRDEEVVCFTENDACGVDAVQYMTGCTMGKGNLILKPTGKMAFTFYDRKNDRSVRLFLKEIKGKMSREEKKNFLLESDYKDLFQITYPKIEVPEKARGFETIICDECEEGAPEHKIRLSKGQKLCLDCYKEYTRGW